MRAWLGALPFPTRRFAVLAAAAAALSVLLAWPWGALLVVVVLGALFGVDARSLPPPEAVRVRREAPRVVALGEERPISWELRNDSARPAHLALAEEPDPSLGVAQRRFELAVPAGGTARLTSTLQPSRRGDRTLHALTVRLTGGWGLAVRQRRWANPGTIRVHPPARGRRLASARVALGLEIGERSARTIGVGTEFDHLRDWIQGDEVRRVDWRATARVGRPVVRVHQAERNQRVIVVIDTGRAVAGLVEEVPRLDHLMDGALAIATLAASLGDRFGLVAYAARTRLVMPPTRALDAPKRAADALYRLDAALEESDHRAAALEVAARVRRRSVVVVLTDLAQPAASRELVPAMRSLAARHLVLVAAVADPADASVSIRAPDRASEVYDTAAAVTATAGRRLANAQLERAGIRTLEAPPATFPKNLIDTFLDLRLSVRV
jgi:uncharacterized protein (DUF58 family)